MEHERTGDVLTFRLKRDFNLLTARFLQRMSSGTSHVRVDLSRARLVDTEAVIALYRLQRDGIGVTLINPPALFREILGVLDLESYFDVEVLSDARRDGEGQ